MKNNFQLPAVQKVSETDLDYYTRQYLQTLVDNNLVVSWINFFSMKWRNPWEGEKKLKSVTGWEIDDTNVENSWIVVYAKAVKQQSKLLLLLLLL